MRRKCHFSNLANGFWTSANCTHTTQSELHFSPWRIEWICERAGNHDHDMNMNQQQQTARKKMAPLEQTACCIWPQRLADGEHWLFYLVTVCISNESINQWPLLQHWIELIFWCLLCAAFCVFVHFYYCKFFKQTLSVVCDGRVRFGLYARRMGNIFICRMRCQCLGIREK